jgi:tRNA threonylcarbamoyladenosine biosynthesis protein TsaE
MANRNNLPSDLFGNGIFCPDAEATRALGYRLGSMLSEGSVLSLNGPLGAGKTCFVQGLAAGMGCDVSEVSSPTFTLVHEYRGGRLPVFHFDFYRLKDESELLNLGFDDYVESGGVCVVEWGARFAGALPACTQEIAFYMENEGRRIRGRHAG